MRLGVDAAREAAHDDEPGSRELPAEAARDRGAVARARARAHDRDGRLGEELGLGAAAQEEPRRRIVDRAQQRREVGRRPRRKRYPPAASRSRYARSSKRRSNAATARRAAADQVRARLRREDRERELRHSRARPASDRRAPPQRARLAPSRTPRARRSSARPGRRAHSPARTGGAGRRRGAAAHPPPCRATAASSRAAPAPRDACGTAASPRSARRRAPPAHARHREDEIEAVEQRARELVAVRASRCAEQLHWAAGSPRPPHGQRFIVPTSWNLAGKTTRPAARETETKPSSSGWRSASSAGRWNSASSSRSSTPRCARLASPGRRCGPPPTIAAVEALWCGARKGARETSGRFVHEPGDRVDPRHLERGIGVERRQDPRQAPREHRLPRAGRAAEEEVVPARSSQLERATGAFLAAHVREVGDADGPWPFGASGGSGSSSSSPRR